MYIFTIITLVTLVGCQHTAPDLLIEQPPVVKRDIKLLGELVGGRIGAKMSSTDKDKLAMAIVFNQLKQKSTWSGNGHQYTATPIKEFVQKNKKCRRFIIEATINGAKERIDSVACELNASQWVLLV